MPDPTTQSNYLSISTEHVAFDWNVDFDRKIIFGSATHTLLVKDNIAKEVIFDSTDLDIASVEVAGGPVPFKLSEKHPVMGSALHVPFSKPIPKGTNVKVKVMYKTSSEAIALQFLDKEQTQGKQFPYLFSQCQPIYARTLAPLQDTPSLKITYSAKVTSTLPVLMSAVRVSPPSDGPAHDGKVIGKETVTYEYSQPTSIPSYLIAIACGNIRYKSFPKSEGKNWSTGIWAEPELIDAAYWEFSEDTNRFLAAEEDIVVPYKFGVYDLLVLPPSFPYGGMENACLTFLTPTLLAGDRTLVDVVVHELTHSWFGNGVTHQDASHFWLNEGWTTYIERVLQEKLHSPAHRGFSFLIGYKALQDALKQYEDRPKYQRLIVNFEIGEDPDDAYSSIPYEKGANLILHLERILGGLDDFLPYVKDYVNTFMGRSISTDIWKEHLYDYWGKHGDRTKIQTLDSVDWDAWFHGEGLSLPVEIEYDLTLAKQAYALAKRWDASRGKDIKSLDFQSNDLESFDSNQKAVFLERLQSYPPLPPAHLAYIGDLYTIAKTTNAEIRFRYYELALLDPTTPESKAVALEAARWVVGDDGTGIVKGRMKFCRPVLRAANRADPKVTKQIFGECKTAFHPIARRLIEKDLGIF
ncbi:peptidase family M1-domain-containing protein [Phellopilus nigrolimitatus]|nr:peptidase family M1-domain-containing protein [Phellopilus nigrolimitatus]